MPTLPPLLRLVSILPAAIAITLLNALPGHSHAVESSLEQITERNRSLSGAEQPPAAADAPQPQQGLRIHSRFSTGEPVRDAAVRLLAPDGSRHDLGHTDGSGRLDFVLPEQVSRAWEVQVDAGPGHRDFIELAEVFAADSDDGGAATPRLQAGAWQRHRLGHWLRDHATWGIGGGLGLGVTAAAGMLVWRRRIR